MSLKKIRIYFLLLPLFLLFSNYVFCRGDVLSNSDTADTNPFKNEIGIGFHSLFLGYGIFSKTYKKPLLTLQLDYKRNLSFGILRFGIGSGSVFYSKNSISNVDLGFSDDHLFFNLGVSKNLLKNGSVYRMRGAIDFVSVFWQSPNLYSELFGFGFSFVNRFSISSRSILSLEAAVALGTKEFAKNIKTRDFENRFVGIDYYRNIVVSYNYSF